jgi:DNA-binding PadR family transcriptional regulator
MVLGLLTQKPMSGYEIQQVLQMTQSDKWAGILTGSIYHALKKMEAEGLVRLEAVEHTGNRTKAIYRITDRGQEEFRKLLTEALTQSSVAFPTALYTAMSFLEALPADVVIAALEEQKRKIEADYEAMKAGEREKEKYGPVPPHVRLLFRNMYDQFELQLRLLNDLQAILGENPPILQTGRFDS